MSTRSKLANPHLRILATVSVHVAFSWRPTELKPCGGGRSRKIHQSSNLLGFWGLVRGLASVVSWCSAYDCPGSRHNLNCRLWNSKCTRTLRFCTARSVEDETRNAELNGNRNPELWGDFSQQQIQMKGKSQFEFVPRDSSEFKSNQNLNSTLYREIPRDLIFSILTSWLKSPHDSGFRLPFNSAFWVSSFTARAVPDLEIAKSRSTKNELFSFDKISNGVHKVAKIKERCMKLVASRCPQQAHLHCPRDLRVVPA